MKKNIYILAGLMAISWLICTLHAQDNNPPAPDIPHDKEPIVVKRVNPVYPESMLRGGGEAIVYMKAFIGVDGSVIEAKSEKIQVTADNIIIVNNDKSAGQKTDGKAFEEASYNAVKQWKFSPAQIQGKPVAVWVTIPFKFKLNEEEKKTSINDSDYAETEKITELIKTNIENILKGTEPEKAKRFVDINALLVYNKETVNLYSVLNGEYKNIHLTEDKESRCTFMKMNISDDKSSALVVWKSSFSKGKKERIHTIVLLKNKAKGWRISHWHVSL